MPMFAPSQRQDNPEEGGETEEGRTGLINSLTHCVWCLSYLSVSLWMSPCVSVLGADCLTMSMLLIVCLSLSLGLCVCVVVWLCACLSVCLCVCVVDCVSVCLCVGCW